MLFLPECVPFPVSLFLTHIGSNINSVQMAASQKKFFRKILSKMPLLLLLGLNVTLFVKQKYNPVILGCSNYWSVRLILFH